MRLRANPRLSWLVPALLACAAPAQFTNPYDGVGRHVRSSPLPIVVMMYQPNTPLSYERISLFGRDGDTLVQVAKDRGSPWVKRVTLDFGSLRPADDPVPFHNPDSSVASFFVCATDGRMYQQTSGRTEYFGTWHAASTIPYNVLMASSMVADNTPDGLGVTGFARGRDGYLYNIFFTRGSAGGWNNWAPVPASPTLSGRPTMVTSADGKTVHVLATDASGNVRHVSFVRGGSGGWTAWQDLPRTRVFRESPMVYRFGALISVLATGADGAVYQSILGTSGWSAWSSLGSGPGGFVSGPFVLNSPDGKTFEVGARTAAGDVYLRTYTRGSGGGWDTWTKWDLAGRMTGTTTARNWHTRTMTVAEAREQLFGASSSVGAWFQENSMGKFPMREAFISGWLTMPDDPTTPTVDESSYEFFHGSDYVKKAQIMVQSLEKLTSFRFSTYDTNRDGEVTIDELMVYWIYPGEGARVRGAPLHIPVPSLSGKGVSLSLGLPRSAAHTSPATICEELCHALFGFEDLYPTSTMPGYVGPGRLSLISNNSAFPHLNPWGKLKLGWVTPKVITQDGWYTLRAIERNNEVLVLHNPTRGTRDYFVVENRWPDGSIEATLPDRGIGVWRVSEYFAGQPDRDRKTLHLLRAGGGTDDSLAFWDASDLRTAYHLTPNSGPESTRWYDNTSSQIAIYHVSKAGSTVQMFVDVPPLRSAPPPPYLPAGFRYVDQKAPYQNPNPNLLTGMSVPQIGTDFRVRVPFSYLGSTFVSHFLLTGLQNPNFSLPAVFRGYVYASTDLVLPTPLGASGQYTEIKLGIPLDFGLVGLDFYQQVARTAPGMSPPYLLSRGIHGTIGN
ncbi:MAG: hypothetical protein H6837_17780 [Planctomycetes bacterium]|nr:hypothetical protein [Planctomycetota bacterium]